MCAYGHTKGSTAICTCMDGNLVAQVSTLFDMPLSFTHYHSGAYTNYNKSIRLTKISIVPLVILVGMDKAWKKEVFSGPRVVC